MGVPGGGRQLRQLWGHVVWFLNLQCFGAHATAHTIACVISCTQYTTIHERDGEIKRAHAEVIASQHPGNWVNSVGNHCRAGLALAWQQAVQGRWHTCTSDVSSDRGTQVSKLDRCCRPVCKCCHQMQQVPTEQRM